MPAFKPDASFFRKIAIGAVGARSTMKYMGACGHHMIELERGSTDTKLWKDVKRKRVRIPDLVCLNCGLRVESRAKTKPDLSMSHSLAEAERAWDFGMIGEDVIAFPVCEAENEVLWTRGRLDESTSYWHERNWVKWKQVGAINCFTVDAFRAVKPDSTARKGTTEGSEVTITWTATFASCSGKVEEIDRRRVTLLPPGGRKRHLKINTGHALHVAAGQDVALNQVLAARVVPLSPPQLRCRGRLPAGHVAKLLRSKERTLRFTGAKLARLLRDTSAIDAVREMSADPEEDLYVRLEGLAYRATVGGERIEDLFGSYLRSPDDQDRLETVITIGEVGTIDAVVALSRILSEQAAPYYLRSAAAWCLGRIGTPDAQRHLVAVFSDLNRTIREEALAALVDVGGAAIDLLVHGLNDANDDIAVGCAEALRQAHNLPENALTQIAGELRSADPSRWAVWLLGHLPKERVEPAIADVQATKPELHYAISLLWSFTHSWISRYWEHHRGVAFPG